MQKLWISAMLVLVLLVATIALQAQEDEEELPEIPYFWASSGFNVPILELEGWDNQHTEDDAIYVNADLNARIVVTMVRTLDDEEAIQTATNALTDSPLTEPLVDSRIGLATGTWTQQLFSVDDISISSFALVRGAGTFVVMLLEDNPNYDVHQVAVRSPILGTTDDGDVQTDFVGGVNLALETFLGEDTNFTLTNSIDLTALGLASVQSQYSTDAGDDLTVFAQELGGITYATITNTDAETATRLGEAIETVFLGFFITPNNSNFLYLGLTMVALIFSVLIGSMWLRYRNVQKDMALVEELSAKE
ncbi:MAG: hypothetical protein Q9P44_01000 [Anaerolineae bacterium]|nr:hypothetical protein [Anaerolineae bacterium]